MKRTTEQSAEVSFDALLAMAVTENARREQAALPDEDWLERRYPDTGRWDRRLRGREERRAPRPGPAPVQGRVTLRKLLLAMVIVAGMVGGALTVSAELYRAVFQGQREFLPIEMQLTYEVEGQPRAALPAGYADHYIPDGFTLDEAASIDKEWKFFHNYQCEEEEKYYSVDCIVIPESGFKAQYDNEHTVWTTTDWNGVELTLGINSSNISDATIYYLFWEKDGIHHAVDSNFNLEETLKIAENIY